MCQRLSVCSTLPMQLSLTPCPIMIMDVRTSFSPVSQVGLFLLMTLYMFWKAPTVEGVLDGSMDPTGVVLKPRVVEVSYMI